MIDLNQLLAEESSEENLFLIDNFLLKNTTVILAAKEKVGKSSIALQLCSSILHPEDFIDLKKENFHVDSIIYLSNDSTMESIKIKINKIGFNKNAKIPIIFDFRKKLSIIDLSLIFKELKLNNVLIIIDVFGGINDGKELDLNNYVYITDLIDKLENAAASNFETFGILILHHLNKKDDFLGSKALASRVSATMKLEVEELEYKYGTLTIRPNDYAPRVVYIKKDLKHHRWVLDKEQNGKEDTSDQFQLLMLNEALSKTPGNMISGNVNDVIAKTRMRISPRKLTRWLKKNKKVLKQNNILYKIRKSGTTIVDVFYKKEV